ncbi:energy-coupling factor ABC transporter permease [Paracoccus niistensis]|uniref:Energy-coupling factor ABC transporter permease n=1 Tax=Paracoccus niistensis TaxID=632935 RepID=A0ABV6I7E6_9RHOB
MLLDGRQTYAIQRAWVTLREQAAASFTGRAIASTALVLSFFEILPHFPVGVSEVHLILGSTLFLIFGVAPAAFGLALGLLLQGLLFAPFDLPQYGMNVTTLLVPLFALEALARRIIPSGMAYVDLGYGQVLSLSLAYQGGIVAWVAFWALYGQGVTASNLAAISTFGGAYLLVVLIEPMVDLLVLASAKGIRGLKGSGWVTPRLHSAA